MKTHLYSGLLVFWRLTTLHQLLVAGNRATRA
jgi:hypothetical protein